MGWGFTARQAATAALTANAIRPVPGFRAAIPAFFAGWLTSELAPHLAAVTAADALSHSIGRRRDPTGLVLAGASLAGLAYLIGRSRGSATVAEEALGTALGAAFTDRPLRVAPSPADLVTSVRRQVNPFAFGSAGRRAGIHVARDIPYAPWGGRGTLDVYTSEHTPAEGAPVLLQVHGGAWVLGDKSQQGIPLMQHLAASGWVCVAINYRLAPRDPWPAQLEDVNRAIAWIKEHIAEHGGDPSYVAITGQSTGGHLTALAALTADDPRWRPGFEDVDTTVQAALPVYGVYDFSGSTGLRSVTLMRDRFLAPRVVQRRYADAPEIYEDASPILEVHPDAPDFFVIHGSNDTLVDVRQARGFVERLRQVSRRTVTYAEFPGAQHAFEIFPSIRSQHLVRAMARYLAWHHETWAAAQDRPAGESADV